MGFPKPSPLHPMTEEQFQEAVKLVLEEQFRLAKKLEEEQFRAAVKLPFEDQVQVMVRDNCPDSPPPMGAKRVRALKVL